MNRDCVIRRAAFAAAACTLAFSGTAWAATVTDTPTFGHPSLAITVSGTSFTPSEAVDVYFDLTDEMLLVTKPSGAFTANLTIPASALPGTHYITVIGRKSGDAGQTTFNVQTRWTQFGFGSKHLGWNPYENVIDVNSAPSLGTLWDVPNNGTGATPVFASNNVFVSTRDGVHAYNGTTGAPVWSQPIGTVYASPTIANGTIYIQNSIGTVYSLKQQTGAINWSQALVATGFSSIAVASGALYVANDSGQVYKLAASDGHTLWSYTTGGYIDSTPTIANGNVYVGATDGNVYALSNGSLVRTYSTGGAVESSVAFANGVIYVGSDDDKIYAFNARTGGIIWSYTTGGAVYMPPVVANGTVYVGSADGSFYALDARTAAVKWTFSTGSLVRPAALANGVVYFSSENSNLYALNAATGAPLAFGALGASYIGGPSVANGIVYLSADNGDLVALAPGAGVDAKRSLPSKPPRAADLHPDRSLLPNGGQRRDR